MPFPFAARMPRLCSPQLVARRVWGLLSALCNFPLVSRSGSLCGRLAGFPEILSRVFISRGARIYRVNSFGVYEVNLLLTYVSHFIVRAITLNVSKSRANQYASIVCVVVSFERLSDHYRDKKESRMTRVYHVILSECVPQRENRRSCAYVVLIRHAP